MDVSDQDRLSPSQKKPSQWLPMAIVVALAILTSAGAYYIYQQQAASPQVVTPLATQTSAPTETQAPLTPTAPPTPIPVVVKIEPGPQLPTLAESDEFLREHWQKLGLPEQLQSWLQGEFILQRVVSFIDGLADGALLRKLSPLDKSTFIRPSSTLQVTQRDGDYWLAPANFERYTKFVSLLAIVNPEHLARSFHWLRPLLESAYEELGQPADHLGNRLIASLDVLLETPDIDTPIKLKRESVYYQFADPALEELPDAQKLLLRMGPQNRKAVKQWATSLKAALLTKT